MNEQTPVRCEHAPDVPLREYIERIFDERQKALDVAFKAQESALRLAADDLARRLDDLNHAHAKAQEDRTQFLTVDKYDSQHKALVEKVALLDAFRGRALGFGALASLISAVAGALIVKAIGG